VLAPENCELLSKDEIFREAESGDTESLETLPRREPNDLIMRLLVSQIVCESQRSMLLKPQPGGVFANHRANP
jgi:hypothetical protein